MPIAPSLSHVALLRSISAVPSDWWCVSTPDAIRVPRSPMPAVQSRKAKARANFPFPGCNNTAFPQLSQRQIEVAGFLPRCRHRPEIGPFGNVASPPDLRFHGASTGEHDRVSKTTIKNGVAGLTHQNCGFAQVPVPNGRYISPTG